MKALALCALLCVNAAVFGQNSASAPKKIAIKFICNCTDTTGAAFATAFRDLLATSPRFVETFASSQKLPNGQEGDNFEIKAVSVDPSMGNDGVSTSISLVFLIGDTYYLGQLVQTCGRNRVSGCASDLLASFDKMVNSPNQ